MSEIVRTDRLRELANHLLYGKLGHENFDFSTFNDFESEIIPFNFKNKCGTNGCAMGECPILWPDDWEFDYNVVKLKESNHLIVRNDATKWFNINRKEFTELFIPKSLIETYNLKNQLSSNATKEEVANNILRFCEEIENKHGNSN